MKSLTALACVAAIAVATTNVHASHVTIPDDFATIQAGIDSGTDSVLVRDGSYPEALVLSRTVVLQGLPTDFGGYVDFDLHPRVLNMIGTGPGAHVAVSGFRARSIVVAPNILSRITVTDCIIDSALDVKVYATAVARNNTIRGDARLLGNNCEASMNLVIGGTLAAYAASTSRIHDNTVFGPAPYGIVGGSDVYVSNNYVRGCVVGIAGGCGYPSGVDNNVVEDCTEAGYFTSPGCNGGSYYVHNIARRCERGFDLLVPALTFTDNTAEDCRSDGMRIGYYADKILRNTVQRCGGNGIVAELAFRVDSNLVLAAGGDGIRFTGYAPFVGWNVVGRCAGAGVVVAEGPSVLANNTCFLNAGAGFELSGNFGPDTVANNIAFANAIGLRMNSPQTALLECNDWYGNLGGTVIGVSEGVSDTTLNPLFCDVTRDSVDLSSVSALVNLPGCGLIGARGIGCPYPAAANGILPSPPIGLHVAPQPGGVAVRFTWQALEASALFEVYDVAGARRWSSVVTPGASELSWRRQDDNGRVLPAGIYFARLSAPGGRLIARVVLSQ